ncbi:hypothetical protein EV363DRAFT_1449731 [Boletus edulis]|nr:hypothetical protein EV363DRAFT_1449731 [Boletus edulis]
MNNLLRTLTESQVPATPDLKLLLNTVKDARRQGYDNRVSDPFYESLEGVLLDLRTVTMDNHDAEAFLKPVSKSDVPDYYDVISNPMDLQTMLKKVKAKQYKSKREFKDDLDLIWSNCFTYNATEASLPMDHPLRQCAIRLKQKADRLLANVTDRKDRVDPLIPPDFSSSPPSRPIARTKINGYSSHDRIRPYITHSHPGVIPPSRSSLTNGIRPAPGMTIKKMNMDVPFGDMPALVRTPEGMAAFRSLDLELDGLGEPGPSTLAHANGQLNQGLLERLRSFVMTPERESESEDEQFSSSELENDAGLKRRSLNGIRNRPRKRARLTPPDSDEEIATRERNRNVTELWWSATQSDALLANGLPSLVQCPPLPSSSHPPLQVKPKPSPLRSPKRKRLKKRLKAPTAPPNTLLSIMNSNIKTMKRVRRTHAKFAALNLNAEDGGGGGGDLDEPPETAEDDPVDEFVDGRPWRVLVGLKGGDSNIELGGEQAVHCLRWMNGRVLEHAGFQGTTASSLDVLTGATSEFLLNVGRTLRFLCDKYGKTMTPEEIILHTLFESGITKIQDLERYIKDDVIRHGARLTDLEKKLVNAFREATFVDVLDDDALFGAGSEDEESETTFAMGLGGFSEAFDEDFLGLRELGIAAESGLSSLTIPKKLLKGKRGGGTGATKVKPTEPPPPYPPPPPFVPITSKNMEGQIGLLRPYYQERFAMLAPSLSAPPLIIGVPLIPPPLGVPVFPLELMNTAGPTPGPTLLTLPDDAPPSSQTKLGPIGQIAKSGPSGGAVKKKAKGTAPPTKDMGGGAMLPLPRGLLTLKPEDVLTEPLMTPFDAEAVAVGDGNGDGGRRGTTAKGALPGGNGNNSAKKKVVDLPPVIAASA